MKQENPELKNTDISRILGNMWRDASEEEKRPYVEKEKAEREQYKIEMEKWKKEHAAKQEAERASQHQQYTVPALDPTYGLVARSPYMDPYGVPPMPHQQFMPHHSQNQYGFGKSVMSVNQLFFVFPRKGLAHIAVHLWQVILPDRMLSRRMVSNP